VAATLRADPDNHKKLRDRLEKLAKELKKLERRAPWIAADYPVELALWGIGGGGARAAPRPDPGSLISRRG